MRKAHQILAILGAFGAMAEMPDSQTRAHKSGDWRASDEIRSRILEQAEEKRRRKAERIKRDFAK